MVSLDQDDLIQKILEELNRDNRSTDKEGSSHKAFVALLVKFLQEHPATASSAVSFFEKLKNASQTQDGIESVSSVEAEIRNALEGITVPEFEVSDQGDVSFEGGTIKKKEFADEVANTIKHSLDFSLKEDLKSIKNYVKEEIAKSTEATKEEIVKSEGTARRRMIASVILSIAGIMTSLVGGGYATSTEPVEPETSTVFPTEMPHADVEYKVKVETHLNVRKEPRIDEFNLIGKLANGDRVTALEERVPVFGKRERWMLIEFKDKEGNVSLKGWVSSKYLVRIFPV